MHDLSGSITRRLRTLLSLSQERTTESLVPHPSLSAPFPQTYSLGGSLLFSGESRTNNVVFTSAFAPPDGIIANAQFMIYDIESSSKTRLPDIPNGVRVANPFDGTASLRLVPTFFTPVCGGSTANDTIPVEVLLVQDPVSDQCSRIKLTPESVRKGCVVERTLEGGPCRR